jgi:DNA-binding MarR family transcriptional regulator
LVADYKYYLETMIANISQQGLEGFQRAMAAVFRHGTLQRFHERVVAAAGIDCERAGFLVMRRVTSEGPIRITDLARDLGLDPSTISRHLRVVEARGWVERRPDPLDRRAALVVATREGQRVVTDLERERRQALAAVLADWDPEDRERLFELTERFAADFIDHIQQTA